jgi:uncharacterized protein
MPNSRTLGAIDLEDILNGATILGSGGGGPYALGKQIVEYLVKQPQPVMLADPDTDVADTQTMAVSAAVGSPVAIGSGSFPMDIAAGAFKQLQSLLQPTTGQAFSFVLPGEVGAGNTFIPMTTAVIMGIPILDASGAPRAMPTLSMATYAVQKDIQISPIVISSPQTSLTFSAQDARSAEGPLRGIIGGAGFGEYAGVAFWAMTGALLKQPGAAIHHSITYAQELGKTLRMATENHLNPVEAVRQYLNGYTVFIGALVDPGETTQGGFDWGTTIVQGSNPAEQVWIYNQNENLIAWNTLSSRPLCIGPDLICYLTTDGVPFTNADLQPYTGKQVAVIAAPCLADYRQPGVIAAYENALQGLGYGGPYVPVEKLQQN